MKSGMIAAETIFSRLQKAPDSRGEILGYSAAFKKSPAYKELHQQRNFGPAMHKFGNIAGAAFAFVDLNIFNGRLPFTLHDKKPDHQQLKPASQCNRIEYPKPDGVISFDRLGSVFISNTNHEEDQPCHLQLEHPDIPIEQNLPWYDEPAQRYCPAGVYEIVEGDNGLKTFQINSQNCVHCKTCDIKDPAQNITWVTPEGGGGPCYPNM